MMTGKLAQTTTTMLNNFWRYSEFSFLCIVAEHLEIYCSTNLVNHLYLGLIV